MSKFKNAQQRVTDCELRNMSPEQVNEILADMKPDEADRFLERLGNVRARDIYGRETARDRDD